MKGHEEEDLTDSVGEKTPDFVVRTYAIAMCQEALKREKEETLRINSHLPKKTMVKKQGDVVWTMKTVKLAQIYIEKVVKDIKHLKLELKELQAMDLSHVAMVAPLLRSEGFKHFRVKLKEVNLPNSLHALKRNVELLKEDLEAVQVGGEPAGHYDASDNPRQNLVKGYVFQIMGGLSEQQLVDFDHSVCNGGPMTIVYGYAIDTSSQKLKTRSAKDESTITGNSNRGRGGYPDRGAS
ncbi:hypothetical protein SUGI_0602950 [Cryptomeria japonica]|nr:hypothetical protein SUGI_0602950 [Cryptomeria japonica]